MGWRQLLLLGLDKGQCQRLLVVADIGVKQVIHTTATALEGLAVDDLDADRALLAPDFAMRGTLGISHLLDPACAVQRRVDQLRAGVGFVE
jgi:hypothetical protein